MAYVNFDKPFTLKDIEAQGFKGNDRISDAAMEDRKREGYF